MAARTKGRGTAQAKYLPTRPTHPTETLTEKEVARRHLATAIDLLVSGGDLLAVHVLSMAAQDIIEAQAKRQGTVTGFAASARKYGKDERRYRDTWRRPFNFLKHGNGGEPLADFVPQSVPVHLVIASMTYVHVYREKQPMFDRLDAWMLAHDPERQARQTPRPTGGVRAGGPMTYLAGRRVGDAD